jgi:dTDP-4-dehydrorhamnose 3,5-epimerase
MEFIKTKLEGVFIIQPKKFSDLRGVFVKTIHEETFASIGLSCKFKESFYSVSKKNVIRGMHFQIPDEDHDKLVYTVKGIIIDVILDLRKQSPTFGQYIAEELSEENRRSVYIPKGLAHGFLSLENDTIVEYHTTTVQSRDMIGEFKMY